MIALLSSGRTVCDASSDFARLHPCVRAVETARLGICLCPSGGEPRGLANSSPDHRRPATWVRRSAHVAPSSANRIGPAALKRHRPGSLQTISAPSASARTRPGVNGIRKLIHFRRSDTGSVFTCRRHPEAARRARRFAPHGAYAPKVRNRIIPGLGKHRLDRLTAEHLERFYTHLEDERLAPATVLQIHRILSRALKVAMQRGYVTRNVATLVDAPLRQPGRDRAADPG